MRVYSASCVKRTRISDDETRERERYSDVAARRKDSHSLALNILSMCAELLLTPTLPPTYVFTPTTLSK